jgi:hypothetical protein
MNLHHFTELCFPYANLYALLCSILLSKFFQVELKPTKLRRIQFSTNWAQFSWTHKLRNKYFSHVANPFAEILLRKICEGFLGKMFCQPLTYIHWGPFGGPQISRLTLRNLKVIEVSPYQLQSSWKVSQISPGILVGCFGKEFEFLACIPCIILHIKFLKSHLV